MLFQNRTDAGLKLAQKLAAYAGRPDVVVLALPRGGVPVAVPVAEALNAPLDVFVVRKLGVPGQEELAMGAVASGGVRVLLPDIVRQLKVTPAQIDVATEAELRELARRERLYRGDLAWPDLRGKTVIVVDDGLATGASMKAAVRALRQAGPARLVVAVPVASPESCARFRALVDEVVCAATPEPFHAVGLWYRDFTQTTDDEVCALLAQARGISTAPPPDP
jgi:putative phosphoribosyl transferase